MKGKNTVYAKRAAVGGGPTGAEEVIFVRAAALSFAGSDFTTRQGFVEYIENTVAPAGEGGPFLLVFPAHLALFYAFRCGDLGAAPNFTKAASAFLSLPPAWYGEFLDLQRALARRLQAYLVPGSILVADCGQIYHEARLLSPGGEELGCQRQLFLSREERDLGWCRGAEAIVFATGLGRLALIIGTDAWYPEVGRVLALQGAEIVCHCGALPAGESTWRQVAGMWQQVQQNQFFCVESQLVATFAGRTWGAPSLIHAPCEMTGGYTGILAGDRGGKEYQEYIEAELDREARQEVTRKYPLLKLLNPAAYQCLAAPLPEDRNET